MTLAHLVEVTFLKIWFCKSDITYDWGYKFLGSRFKYTKLNISLIFHLYQIDNHKESPVKNFSQKDEPSIKKQYYRFILKTCMT